MKLKGKISNVVTDLNGNAIISLQIKDKTNLVKSLDKLLNEPELDIDISKHCEKRSLNANAYLWVLLEKIAEVIGSSKDEVYLMMLGRYGQFTHVVVKQEVVERIKQEWRLVKELGEIEINGQKGIQLQCYFGSSTYNTKEMARLIDGVVSECDELGIETMTPDELRRLKEQWNVTQ